ncbi:MAG: NADH-quinone oxidoreductase subunit A [Propionibacteriaceae bacterium]|jgi:NADH-quinone oxidoreductase subunit A|nr:NADH-quinone oxidoreductase subunit A [Propionibacteriaceae bacterium]
MSPYVPLLGVMALAALFLAVAIFLSAILGPRRRNKTKYESYECGIDPTPEPPGGGKFPIKYYLIAMLYIIFDIEIVFLYPWAVSFNQLGLFALVEMLLFMATVFVAYIYIWRRGGLEWD